MALSSGGYHFAWPEGIDTIITWPRYLYDVLSNSLGQNATQRKEQHGNLEHHNRQWLMNLVQHQGRRVPGTVCGLLTTPSGKPIF